MHILRIIVAAIRARLKPRFKPPLPVEDGDQDFFVNRAVEFAIANDEMAGILPDPTPQADRERSAPLDPD
jgi:hypothetical protein